MRISRCFFLRQCLCIFSIFLSSPRTGSLATLILPAAIYLKVMPPDSKNYRTSQVLLVAGFVVMFAVVIVTIVDII